MNEPQAFAQTDAEWLASINRRATGSRPAGQPDAGRGATPVVRRADPLLRWLPGALRTACRTAPSTGQIQRGVRLGRRCRAWTSLRRGAWPLSEHAADVVLLQHGLDFCLSPHRLLREAARTVRPGGHLLLIGINPWSLWGIRHYFAGDALRQARCIPPSRACDWLNLLGFALEKRRFGCYRPPLASAAWAIAPGSPGALGRRLAVFGRRLLSIGGTQAGRGVAPVAPEQARTARSAGAHAGGESQPARFRNLGMTDKEQVVIYTDGACKGNPGARRLGGRCSSTRAPSESFGAASRTPPTTAWS